TADPPGFGNLDAQLRLLASDGSTIAEDAPEDSQRAAITATLPAGTYSVQVKSREGYADVGQYSVTASETRGPRVVRAEVAAAAPEQSLLAFTFDEAVHGSTFGVDDVRVGFAPGASVLSVEASGDGITQFVRIANSPTAARMNVTIGPEIADLFGNRLDQNQNGVGGEASDTYTFEVLSVAAPVLQP
ncbi:MAG TPA: hypothetical protein VNN80_09695, partial [Polyangiaceae bacterium]|nr:hypothetical protein [Polyangiaceae bacterium]